MVNPIRKAMEWGTVLATFEFLQGADRAKSTRRTVNWFIPLSKSLEISQKRLQFLIFLPNGYQNLETKPFFKSKFWNNPGKTKNWSSNGCISTWRLFFWSFPNTAHACHPAVDVPSPEKLSHHPDQWLLKFGNIVECGKEEEKLPARYWEQNRAGI